MHDYAAPGRFFYKFCFIINIPIISIYRLQLVQTGRLSCRAKSGNYFPTLKLFARISVCKHAAVVTVQGIGNAAQIRFLEVVPGQLVAQITGACPNHFRKLLHAYAPFQHDHSDFCRRFH